MGVMEMTNIARIKSTSLAFWVSILTITPSRLTDVASLIMPTYLYGSFPERSVQITTLAVPWNCNSFNAYNYIYTGNDFISMYIVGSITIQHVACTGSW